MPVMYRLYPTLNLHIVLASLIAASVIGFPTPIWGRETARSAKLTISGDFDGVPGIETASITDTTVRITSRNSGAVREYRIGSWKNVQQIDYDGQPGNEILFTSLTTINGIAQPAQATVLNDRARKVRIHDVGRANRFQILHLDDQPGNEILFTNLLVINGSAQPAQASVLTHRDRDLRTYNVGSPNRFQVIDLDGQPGPEILFTNLKTINGIAQPAQATVLSDRDRNLRTYNVGSPNHMEVVELEGQPGAEILFTNLLVINGSAQPAQASVLTHRDRDLRTYNVGSPNHLQVVELEGGPGKEVLFTNVQTINGFAQPARATVITHLNREVNSYDVGLPNSMQLAELEGQPGDEIVFTNLQLINGVAQPASASVVNHRGRRVRTYDVGRPRSLKTSDLDGVSGEELAFVAETSVAVVTAFREDVYSYSVGAWSSYQVLDWDGITGEEMLFRRRDGKRLVVIHRTRATKLLQ